MSQALDQSRDFAARIDAAGNQSAKLLRVKKEGAKSNVRLVFGNSVEVIR
jgi:hypothetical protein